ncbi:FtsK/SpoIIIE domain-containing protein [Arthrobacter sp. ISL-5]|uniref:FtsK/SpoIIIE domain-containing protein n=1 Tax=Arthrobacter sp. ISL-5 TaxID=2819111 RepID=UPI001BE9189F|nr:FtsK/SpoIIIE domain-containing protein [Arthrobacter sp. ISL-5]MBT2553695.1 FHA domain-containing protein [Arthrobacter sp. ISL-5]
MTLHCTLVRGPGAARPDAAVELTVRVRPGCPGAELDRAVSGAFGTRELTVNGLPLDTMTVGEVPLVNGAVLVDGGRMRARPRPRPASDPSAALLLAVHSGPCAGTVLPLRRGSYRIGRTNAELTIPDPDLSREHARIEVSDTAMTILDLDSVNGTEVDGKRVRNAVISTSSLIRCGNSTLSVLVAGTPGSRISLLGSAGLSVAEPLNIPRTAEQGSRAALLLGALLPVALGLGLALVTGMWLFLAFAAVSAMAVMVPVLAGSRRRRGLRSAVLAAAARDKERRRRSAPSAAELALYSPGMVEPEGAEQAASGVWLRLGTADQLANIRFEPEDPDFRLPGLGAVPLVLDPELPLVTVRGPDNETQGMMRSILMQLTGYPLARGTRIVVHGPPSVLPLTARYLPAVTLHGAAGITAALLAEDPTAAGVPGVLLIAGSTAASTADAGLIEGARRHGWRVIHFTDRDAYPADTDIELGERRARFHSPASTRSFFPDLVPLNVFDRYCRQSGHALVDAARPAASLPAICLLTDILDASAAGTAQRWASGRLMPGLAVPIGRSAHGVRFLDLEADGPHVLIAGTTGSGKSELLRTLAAALALSFPPDRVNVLFFDFKGGSGLGPLTALPHCVGMLTDLTRSELDRTLVSLRAEVRRREQALAAAAAPDLAAYRLSKAGDEHPLPQLVLIIDEFRILVEDAPESLSELMRIAAIGRSLGIHLVMATQRPQGALTADIRANVTTSIALRVQSAHESADVIGTNAASRIAVETPGRAFLARGTEAPEVFQSASLSGTLPEVGTCEVTVLRTCETLEMPAPAAAGDGHAPPQTPAAAAMPIAALTCSLWESLGGAAVHSPVAMPLPDVLPCPHRATAPTAAGPKSLLPDRTSDLPEPTGDLPDAAAAPGDGWRLELGWLDLPEEQRLARLNWRPGTDGHLALIGGSSADPAEALSITLDQLLAHSTESHLYVLDADGSFAALASSSRAGAVVNLHDLRRGVRVLERLSEEMSRRLSRPATTPAIPLVLAISGWGSWVSAVRAGPLLWAEDLVHGLVRDGHGAGIAVIVSGDRELVTARFFSAVPNRIYFPRGASEESRLAWPKMPEIPAVPGRAVAIGALAGNRQGVCQLYAREGLPAPEVPPQESGRTRPFRVDPLPLQVPLAELLARIRSPEESTGQDNPDAGRTGHGRRRNLKLCIGVGGDDLAPVSVRVPCGGVLAVLGAAGSGKSSFLGTVRALNPTAGWLFPAPEANQSDYWAETHAEAVHGRLAKDAVLLVDDAELLPAATHQLLLDLNALGWTVILTAGFGSALVQRVPLALAARNCGSGILIAPRSPMDGDLFGLRYELEPNPPPGRAVLLAEGRAMAVQLAVP